MAWVSDWRAFVRWGVKSTATLGLNLLLLTVWVDGAGIPAELAIWINWLTVPIAGYLITDAWVFTRAPAARGWRGHLRRYVAMLTVNNGAKLGNYVIYVLLIQYGLDYRLAWVVGAIAMLVVTFGGNREVWDRGVGS